MIIIKAISFDIENKEKDNPNQTAYTHHKFSTSQFMCHQNGRPLKPFTDPSYIPKKAVFI